MVTSKTKDSKCTTQKGTRPHVEDHVQQTRSDEAEGQGVIFTSQGHVWKRIPPDLSSAEIEDLHLAIIQGGGNVRRANAQVERIAHNIAVTMNDPDTPADIISAIQDYVGENIHLLSWIDASETLRRPEAVRAVFPVACRVISQIPFVPQARYIEVLTSGDVELARLVLDARRPRRRQKGGTR